MTFPPSALSPRGRRLLLSGLVALTSACGGGGGDGPPTQPSPPPGQPTVPSAVPGTLTVRLVTPHPDDGALLFEISGPAPAAELAPATQGPLVHARVNGNTTRVAVFGAISAGALVRFSVPDVNAAPQFSARVVEASDRASALRTDVTGYQLTIAP